MSRPPNDLYDEIALAHQKMHRKFWAANVGVVKSNKVMLTIYNAIFAHEDVTEKLNAVDRDVIRAVTQQELVIADDFVTIGVHGFNAAADEIMQFFVSVEFPNFGSFARTYKENFHERSPLK